MSEMDIEGMNLRRIRRIVREALHASRRTGVKVVGSVQRMVGERQRGGPGR